MEIDNLNAAISNGAIKTSILRIKDVTVNDVAGMYWCVVIINVDVSEVSHLEFHSDKSNVTTIKRASDILNDERECESEIQTSVSTHCVSFQVLPPDPLPGVSSADTALVTSGSSTPGSVRSTTQPRGSLDGATVLSTTMIIILSAVGGILCFIIHVLLVIVSGLCIKNRRKKRVRRGNEGNV